MIGSISIDNQSRVPKYKQLASVFAERIARHSARVERLPSINDLSAGLDVSRDTVERAYRELRRLDLIVAVPGKGYYVKTEKKTEQERNVLLLFGEMREPQRIVYRNLTAALPESAATTVYTYAGCVDRFERIMRRQVGQYTDYVVWLPGSGLEQHRVERALRAVPPRHLFLLNGCPESFNPESGYSCLYQNVEDDIYGALTQLKPELDRYQSVKLVYSPTNALPRAVLNGFQKYCIEFRIRGKVVPDIDREPVSEGDAYITLNDSALATLIKQCQHERLTLSREVGVVAYQDGPLKEVLLGGITVISTDFAGIGTAAGEFITGTRQGVYPTSVKVIRRGSL